MFNRRGPGAHPLTTFIHQITRPLCTVVVVVTYSAMFAAGIVQPEAFKDVVLIVVGFWFAQRTSEHRATDVSSVPTNGTHTPPLAEPPN